ncbi:hypothetical protein GCM10025751_42410 [Haladaptatus pallidirubidus]|uniref:Curlin associated repeat-containing protein n=1 Tax=Haladaptatus pallidirubidus TaxID=1008152 RepID=A0AAV3UME8_9EURY
MKGIAAAGLGAGTVLSASSAATTDADGQNVYLLFGVDTEEDLESWLENQNGDAKSSSQDSSSEVIQYQDVDQLNVNQQENAVAISIDGGQADAIQRAYQTNANTQDGDAQSINAKKEDKEHTFKGVKDAYIIFAGDTDSREFSGWVVSDHTYKSEQTANAEIDQEQEVDQVNYNSQSTAVAIAEGGSYARSFQRSYQRNQNAQEAAALALNIADGHNHGHKKKHKHNHKKQHKHKHKKQHKHGHDHDQDANSSVEQWQDVDQLNVNEQGVAVAISVGEDSIAKAWQVSIQLNINEQVANAAAINFDPQSVEEAAASARMQGDFSDSNVKRMDNDGQQSNAQGSSATVSQFQNVSQQNINLQNAAVAVALNRSDSYATQSSHQANFNAQIAEATAANIDVGKWMGNGVLNGQDAKGDGSWAVSYDNGGSQSNQQTALADIEQAQYVEQLNVNEQYSAVAYAEDDGTAIAEQLNYQVNRNEQVAEAEAGNGNSGGSNDGGKNKQREQNSC